MCSFLSANIDPLVCVGFVCWKELNKWFLYFYLFRDAGHYVHSSVLVIEMNCALHTIEELSTLDNNFATESVFEKCTQTVHVLVTERQWIQFL